ncbi:hypothetical protein BFP70_01420 [Thioclava sp. SK-1]|uniref:hypothetical protein n=1 Tax=Thioclava sp. SK-1 TaxID=1889770 RepID=UPI000826A91F|nr:hypothetical protein [Thioclava sp. SK-1]OCX61268.1 hypothetical protein BFP70_01420 [Thioclava sp. SK-1]
MRITPIAVALTAALAGGAVTANAQTFSPAQVQLSTEAGVQPGVYTIGQLDAIIKAQRDTNQSVDVDQLKSAFVLENAGAAPAGAGDAQLAAQAGVPAGKYTTGQLQQLVQASRNHTDPDAKQRLIDAYAKEDATQNAGLAQLAARAGIDPAGKTPAQIAAAYVTATSDLDNN